MDRSETGLQMDKDCPALMINVNVWMRPAFIFAMEFKNQYMSMNLRNFLSLRTK